MKILKCFKKICKYLITLLLLSNFSSVYAQWEKISIDTLYGPCMGIPTVADIEDDGDIDILLSHCTSITPWEGKIIWYQSPGWIKHDIQNSFGIAKSSDLNNDNKSDIIATSVSTGEVSWYEAPSWNKHVIGSDFDMTLQLEISDLDNDNDADIIVVGSKNDSVKIVWYEAPDWLIHIISENLYGLGFNFKTADIDLDNDIDVIVPSYGGLFWFEAPSWSSHTIDSMEINYNLMDIGDIDNDGDIDVVIGECNNDQIIWYENPTWSKHVVASLYAPCTVVLVDLDNDNDLDIVTTGQTDNLVLWYESPSWTEHIIDDSLEEAWGLCATDIDGDSLTDIIACGAAEACQLVLYKNTGTGVISEDISPKIPMDLILQQNFPNPFIDKTLIEYNLPRSSNVNIAVYNVLGSRVNTLLNKRQNAGIHTIIWDGRDERGNKVPSGFYFLRLVAGDFEGTRKLLLIR